jgi:hypothetical protein
MCLPPEAEEAADCSLVIKTLNLECQHGNARERNTNLPEIKQILSRKNAPPIDAARVTCAESVVQWAVCFTAASENPPMQIEDRSRLGPDRKDPARPPEE